MNVQSSPKGRFLEEYYSVLLQYEFFKSCLKILGYNLESPLSVIIHQPCSMQTAEIFLPLDAAGSSYNISVGLVIRDEHHVHFASVCNITRASLEHLSLKDLVFSMQSASSPDYKKPFDLLELAKEFNVFSSPKSKDLFLRCLSLQEGSFQEDDYIAIIKDYFQEYYPFITLLSVEVSTVQKTEPTPYMFRLELESVGEAISPFVVCSFDCLNTDYNVNKFSIELLGLPTEGGGMAYNGVSSVQISNNPTFLLIELIKYIARLAAFYCIQHHIVSSIGVPLVMVSAKLVDQTDMEYKYTMEAIDQWEEFDFCLLCSSINDYGCELQVRDINTDDLIETVKVMFYDKNPQLPEFVLKTVRGEIARKYSY